MFMALAQCDSPLHMFRFNEGHLTTSFRTFNLRKISHVASREGFRSGAQAATIVRWVTVGGEGHTVATA
jgi:hypothetical protein